MSGQNRTLVIGAVGHFWLVLLAAMLAAGPEGDWQALAEALTGQSPSLGVVALAAVAGYGLLKLGRIGFWTWMALLAALDLAVVTVILWPPGASSLAASVLILAAIWLHLNTVRHLYHAESENKLDLLDGLIGGLTLVMVCANLGAAASGMISRTHPAMADNPSKWMRKAATTSGPLRRMDIADQRFRTWFPTKNLKADVDRIYVRTFWREAATERRFELNLTAPDGTKIPLTVNVPAAETLRFTALIPPGRLPSGVWLAEIHDGPTRLGRLSFELND